MKSKTHQYLQSINPAFSDFIKNRGTFNLFPQHVYIEPTNACNLGCKMCSRKSMQRPVTTMSLTDCRKVIDDLASLGIYPRLTFTGSGEPLLDPHLEEKICYAKKHGFNVSIITNATLLDRIRSRSIMASGLDRIQFSIDSIRQSVYDQIRIPASRDKNSYFTMVMDYIKGFLALSKDQPIFTSICAVQMPENRDEKSDFLDFWQQLGVNNVYQPAVNVRAGRGGLEPYFRESLETTCLLPFAGLDIMSNGEVPVCSPTKELTAAGNIRNQSIKEIWQGEILTEARQLLLAKDADGLSKRNILCQQCDAWQSGLSFEEYLIYHADRNQKITEFTA